MDRLREQTDRMFARVEAVLAAIENGQDPQPALRSLCAAQPWDVIAAGQAFVRDVIDEEQASPGRESGDSLVESQEPER